MKPQSVVILADDDDPHLPYVTRYLQEEPLIINIGEAPVRGMTYEYDEQWPEIFYNGRALSFGTNSPRSVWYRGLDFEQLGNINVRADEMAYAISAFDRLGASLEPMLSDAFWVSDRRAVTLAELKPHQLVVARRVGLTVPRTLITSESQRAQAFLNKLGRCVIKPIARRPPTGYNQYTIVVSKEDPPDFGGLNVTPHIFQEVIDPDYELRVPLVGNDIFASVVEDSDPAVAKERGLRDWRYSFENDSFVSRPYELPGPVADQCRALIRELGLVSGMIDMAVKDGVYYFFEINANGQWAFVDDETVGSMGRSLARMLERGRVS